MHLGGGFGQENPVRSKSAAIQNRPPTQLKARRLFVLPPNEFARSKIKINNKKSTENNFLHQSSIAAFKKETIEDFCLGRKESSTMSHHSPIPARRYKDRNDRRERQPKVPSTGRRREDLMRFTLHSELTSLVEEVDRKVLVQLRDGRKLVGVLRSFDQFANIVLTDTAERFYLGQRFGDIKLGIYLVKGESVVLLGEIDEEKDASLPNRIPEEELAAAYKEAEAFRQTEQHHRARAHIDPEDDLF